MDFIKENKAAIVVAALIAGMVTMGVLANMSDNAKDKTDDSKQSSKIENKKKSDDTSKKDSSKKEDSSNEATAGNGAKMEKTDAGVTLTAEVGDSYTTLARQAVQDADKDLSKAQVIAAETYLTQWANEPAVDVDQTVTIKAADLNNAVKKANNLSKAELAAWETYVPYVQF